MFVGHYSVAFAVKSERNRIPLWVLFVAVQFLDYVWATLVLLGIEKLRVIKGFTAGSMLDSYYHPYSHSLIAAVLWSSMAAIGYKSLCTSLRILAISRSTTTHGKWVLVFGIIAASNLDWRWRCLLAELLRPVRPHGLNALAS